MQSCEINATPVTVVYGHFRLTSVSANIGDTLTAGKQFAVLGTGHSSETAGERKHLHLGIHRGTMIDIRGYVSKQFQLKGRSGGVSCNAKSVNNNPVIRRGYCCSDDDLYETSRFTCHPNGYESIGRRMLNFGLESTSCRRLHDARELVGVFPLTTFPHASHAIAIVKYETATH